MIKLLPRVILALFFWGVFGFVIFAGVPYPNSLTSATFTQLLFFLAPLFFALTLTINVATRFLITSAIVSFGLILILVLKALDILNLVSATLTILALYFFISYFKENQPKSKFPQRTKIHNIGLLKKQTKSRLSPLKKLYKIHE